jgi:hypothetical protein
MNIRPIKAFLFVSLLFYRGMVIADTTTDVNGTPQPTEPSQPPKSNDAQTQIEQAADHFDAFALQMPKVINAKLASFMKHGFRAILLNDPETALGEEEMIRSLISGLHNIGNALEDDMAAYANKRSSGAGIDPEKIKSAYHSSSSPAKK